MRTSAAPSAAEEENDGGPPGACTVSRRLEDVNVQPDVACRLVNFHARVFDTRRVWELSRLRPGISENNRRQHAKQQGSRHDPDSNLFEFRQRANPWDELPLRRLRRPRPGEVVRGANVASVATPGGAIAPPWTKGDPPPVPHDSPAPGNLGQHDATGNVSLDRTVLTQVSCAWTPTLPWAEKDPSGDLKREVKAGGDDGTRTRDLRRDRPAF